MTSGIYIIENKVDGLFYIGSAVNLVARWNKHRSDLSRGIHKNAPMQAAWRRDGGGAFSCRPLFVCDKADLLFFEQRALDAYRATIDGYNLNPIAGSFLGYKRGPFTAEHKAKLAAAHVGRVYKKRTPEQRARMSEAQRKRVADGNGNTGVVFTTAVRAKLSAFMRGRRMPPEAVEKMAATKRGKALSPEHRRKIADSQIGFWTAERRAQHAAVIKASWAQRRIAACP